MASGKGAASERRAASGDAAASGKRVAAASTMDWTDAATRGGPSQLGAAGGQPAASLAALALVLGDAPKLLAFTMLVWVSAVLQDLLCGNIVLNRVLMLLCGSAVCWYVTERC